MAQHGGEHGMTREDIVALMKQRNAAWAARDAAALAATHAATGVVASPLGGALEGREEIERVYRTLLNAFSDLRFYPEELIIDGNRVVQIAKLAGTHTGEFFGMPPTSRHVVVQVALLMSVANGLVVEERRIYDFTGMLVQVGVLKARPNA